MTIFMCIFVSFAIGVFTGLYISERVDDLIRADTRGKVTLGVDLADSNTKDRSEAFIYTPADRMTHAQWIEYCDRYGHTWHWQGSFDICMMCGKHQRHVSEASS